MRTSRRWTRAEAVDPTTQVETEVEVLPARDGTVKLPIEVLERFLHEAGYEEVT